MNTLGSGSISRRLLWAVAVALGLMLGAAATVLDLRFQSLSEAALRAQVRAGERIVELAGMDQREPRFRSSDPPRG